MPNWNITLPRAANIPVLCPEGSIEILGTEIRFRTEPPALPGTTVDLRWVGGDKSVFEIRVYVETMGENGYTIGRRVSPTRVL